MSAGRRGIEARSTVVLERLYPLAAKQNPVLALRILAELHRRHGCLEGW
jgi:hypothetical protein